MNNILKDVLGNILNPHIPRYDYKVGDLFLTTNTENPSQRFGGTWQLIAKGKTLVGVDSDDADFSTAEKTGGEKAHKLTKQELPNYNIASLGVAWAGGHSGNVAQANSQNQYCQNAWLGEKAINLNGGNEAHNNMPPYFTCFIWQKVSN